MGRRRTRGALPGVSGRGGPAATTRGAGSLRRGVATLILVVAAGAAPAPAALVDELGRNEVRVVSAAVRFEVGDDAVGRGLPERLDQLGYRRVHRRPDAPGQYFWGREVFWLYRRPFRSAGDDRPEGLWRLDLGAEGRISSIRGPSRERRVIELEPLLLSESLARDRALSRPTRLDLLPERVWRPLLAAEDSRFFDHVGLDARGLARAALANARAGRVVQGGSTITQQLIKTRDLSPRRTMGRKVSEALRALALEAEHEKEEILEAYLDSVYYGHVEGLAVHGLETAARVYYSRGAAELTLGEAAVMAAMVQGPNRLSPLDHPEAALERQRWVLGRLQELGWASGAEVVAARRLGLGRLEASSPTPPHAPRFLSWLEDRVAAEAPRRLADGRGVVVETLLDPWLQTLAETAVAEGLDELRARRPALRRQPLSAALVALDGRDGSVLAWVGGDPGSDSLERVAGSRRQPGSSLKPLVLLEAFQHCGAREPLHPATRVADRPVAVDLPAGAWRPTNPGGDFAGVVDLRRALVESRNVPFVRVARWCGWTETAHRLRQAGLELPPEPPPSFVLGSVETTPLALASAYTSFVDLGRRHAPRAWRLLGRPAGGTIDRGRPEPTKVSGSAAAYLVRDLMRQALTEGLSTSGALARSGVFGKTGTSSDRRDAWLAGGAGSVVAVVWVGLDDGSSLGLGGRSAAGPIWLRFMERVIAVRPGRPPARPARVVERWIEPRTGRRLDRERPGARLELFRRSHQPPGRSWLRSDPPLIEIE